MAIACAAVGEVINLGSDEPITINDLAAALATAQASMGPAIKGKKNPHFRSNYADLSSVVEAIREPFTANGLSWVQAPSVDPETGLVTVTTRILHSSGQWMEASVAAMPGRGGKADLSPQAVGSAVTYLRRYGLQAMAGVPSADDDGEAAMGRYQQRREPPRQQRRQRSHLGETDCTDLRGFLLTFRWLCLLRFIT